jgi:hypothetical protein
MVALQFSRGRRVCRWCTHIASILYCFSNFDRERKPEFMSSPLNMHAARMALNQDPEIRKWAEEWLKRKERIVQGMMTEAEFEKHWPYVRPERMHEGALEAVAAYREREA